MTFSSKASMALTMGMLMACSVQAFTSPTVPTVKEVGGGRVSAHSRTTRLTVTRVFQAIVEDDQQLSSSSSDSPVPELSHKLISNLKFRQLKQLLEQHHQPVHGTTAQLRSRLRQTIFPDEECVIRDGVEECGPDIAPLEGVTFVDESNPIQELLTDVDVNCQSGHWKSAVRKLKKLTRKFPAFDIPEETFLQVLECCSLNRLQAARASEPARKIMEQLVENGFVVPDALGNHCLDNCLGGDSLGTHQGFGGVDTALAMLSTMQPYQVTADTYRKLILALAKDQSLSEGIHYLQTLIVEKSETPALEFFATVMETGMKQQPDHVVTILNYVKAAGYDLDAIGESEDGRRVLAAAIVAAQSSQKDPLAFRLLSAASKTNEGKGDGMVANRNSAVQRACVLLHKTAIEKTIQDDQWKLAVKVLELMLHRSLKPSPWIWRNVVAVCAKNSKSRRATGLLLDWVRLYEAGKAEKPVLSAFNSCINACEICGEEDLTLMVLDSMQKTHNTDGNLITFNIALKRLAKLGNYEACEGIVVGMLKAGVEPSVVTYTTAIAACASSETKSPTVAYEWIQRMRSRKVQPNVMTYNTALAACNDGTLEGSFLGSKLATEMLNEVEKQLADDNADEEEIDVYKNVVPDLATKEVARKLMIQLKQNWNDNKIDKRVATDTVRRPFLLLVDFQKTEMAERAREIARRRKASGVVSAEMELEHRVAEV